MSHQAHLNKHNYSLGINAEALTIEDLVYFPGRSFTLLQITTQLLYFSTTLHYSILLRNGGEEAKVHIYINKININDRIKENQ